MRGKELGVIWAFVAGVNLEANTGSTVSVHGVQALLARSGTACRAPTEETARAKRTMSRCVPGILRLWRVAAWGTGRNACATERRKTKARVRQDV
jgi:hypothetical protein